MLCCVSYVNIILLIIQFFYIYWALVTVGFDILITCFKWFRFPEYIGKELLIHSSQRGQVPFIMTKVYPPFDIKCIMTIDTQLLVSLVCLKGLVNNYSCEGFSQTIKLL